MSQEKVDRYKKSKANRKKEIKKQKHKKILSSILWSLLGLAVVVFLVYSVLVKVKPSLFEEETTAGSLYSSSVTADELREKLIASGEITTSAEENTVEIETKDVEVSTGEVTSDEEVSDKKSGEESGETTESAE